MMPPARPAMPGKVLVIGGGLAGCEAAWALARAGISVELMEMRPCACTPAHRTSLLAELVCSNSLRSSNPMNAAGLLKEEMRALGSLVMDAADACRVPAGDALAVDREKFGRAVTERLEADPLVSVVRGEATGIPPGRPVILATGPLTSDRMSAEIELLAGSKHLYFYDAIAPIVEADSIDMTIAFRQSRYEWPEDDQPEGDYLNCPFTKEEYATFINALVTAERIELREFEREGAKFFEGCLPIEIMAKRGHDALAYGPMKPIGLRDPRTGKRPHAVVQLRQDNLAGTLYNIVGYQTNLKWPEQKRVFRLIPGLTNAEFLRYGMLHRNTFINAPLLLDATMQFRSRSDLFFAGQITGVEGYIGNAASGLVAGLNAARLLRHEALVEFPATTMLGALCHYVTHADPDDFQPMKANYGILPPLGAARAPRGKRERYQAFSRRALEDMRSVVLGFA